MTPPHHHRQPPAWLPAGSEPLTADGPSTVDISESTILSSITSSRVARLFYFSCLLQPPPPPPARHPGGCCSVFNVAVSCTVFVLCAKTKQKKAQKIYIYRKLLLQKNKGPPSPPPAALLKPVMLEPPTPPPRPPSHRYIAHTAASVMNSMSRRSEERWILNRRQLVR